jgi:ADP-ribose pyrophosphatase
MKMKILDADKVTDIKYVNLFRIAYQDRFQNRKDWYIASRRQVPAAVSGPVDRPDAVIVVPFHRRRNRLVLIHQFRVSLGDFQYEFPAGLVDPGETIEVTARRELREETGLHVERTLRTGPTVFASAGMTDEAVAMVYVECTGEPSARGNEGSEEIRVVFVDPKRAATLCADPRARFDVKAWLVLSSFARWGRL